MATAYGYVRVSHADSRESGIGIDVQKRQALHYFEYIQGLEKYAGLEFGGFHEDLAKSAWKLPFLSRPGGRTVSGRLQPGDHLIIAKLDRAFRNVKDMITMTDSWSRRGIHVHFVDLQMDITTANGKMAMQMIAVGAEWHSNTLSERMREVVAKAKITGRVYHGKKKWGYKVVKTFGKKYWEKDPKEREFLQFLVSLKEKGYTYRQVCEEVERRQAAKEKRPVVHFIYQKFTVDMCKKAIKGELAIQRAEAEGRKRQLERAQE